MSSISGKLFDRLEKEILSRVEFETKQRIDWIERKLMAMVEQEFPEGTQQHYTMVLEHLVALSRLEFDEREEAKPPPALVKIEGDRAIEDLVKLLLE